jgi:G:T-mismatch repair DNA endonuclease (very short patch repair protein)
MKKKSHEQFLTEAHQIHGEKYNYPDEYTNTRTKINIECSIHGLFSQLPQNHLLGQGCPVCNPRKKLEEYEVLDKFKKIHGDKYDYSQVKYKGVNHNVNIICSVHGIFSQQVHSHLYGHGCPKCSKTALQDNEKIIKRFIEVHGDKYDYTEMIYENILEKVELKCHKHGSFWQAPAWHISGHECPKCRPFSTSKASIKWLNGLNIEGLQTFESPEGEFQIPGTRWKVDGYDKLTNTVYEFHGTFWHGHPSHKLYIENEKHPKIDATWNEIYQRTLNRDNKIIELGYNLIVKWEHETL